MTTENKEIVSVDGKDYTVEDMTPEQQYIIAQVKNINSKKQNINLELDQLNAAAQFFNNALGNSLKTFTQFQYFLNQSVSMTYSLNTINNSRYKNLIYFKGEIRAYF